MSGDRAKFRITVRSRAGYTERTIWDEKTARGVFDQLASNTNGIVEVRLEVRGMLGWKTLAYDIVREKKA